MLVQPAANQPRHNNNNNSIRPLSSLSQLVNQLQLSSLTERTRQHVGEGELHRCLSPSHRHHHHRSESVEEEEKEEVAKSRDLGNTRRNCRRDEAAAAAGRHRCACPLGGIGANGASGDLCRTCSSPSYSPQSIQDSTGLLHDEGSNILIGRRRKFVPERIDYIGNYSMSAPTADELFIDHADHGTTSLSTNSMSGLCSMGAAAITSGTLIKPTPSAFANRRSHCGCGACSSSRHCARHASAIRSELFHPMPAKRACRSTRTAHSSSSSSSLHHHQPQQQPASRFDCFCTCPHPDRPSIDVLEAHMNQLPRPVAVHPLFPHSEVDSKSVSGKSCCPSKVGAAQTVRHRAREVVAPGSRLSWHNPIQSVHKIAHNHQLLSLDCCGHVGSTVATQLHSGLATSQRPQKNTRPHCCAPVLTGDSSLPSPTDSSTSRSSAFTPTHSRFLNLRGLPPNRLDLSLTPDTAADNPSAPSLNVPTRTPSSGFHEVSLGGAGGDCLSGSSSLSDCSKGELRSANGACREVNFHLDSDGPASDHHQHHQCHQCGGVSDETFRCRSQPNVAGDTACGGDCGGDRLVHMQPPKGRHYDFDVDPYVNGLDAAGAPFIDIHVSGFKRRRRRRPRGDVDQLETSIVCPNCPVHAFSHRANNTVCLQQRQHLSPRGEAECTVSCSPGGRRSAVNQETSGIDEQQRAPCCASCGLATLYISPRITDLHHHPHRMSWSPCHHHHQLSGSASMENRSDQFSSAAHHVCCSSLQHLDDLSESLEEETAPASSAAVGGWARESLLGSSPSMMMIQKVTFAPIVDVAVDDVPDVAAASVTTYPHQSDCCLDEFLMDGPMAQMDTQETLTRTTKLHEVVAAAATAGGEMLEDSDEEPIAFSPALVDRSQLNICDATSLELDFSAGTNGGKELDLDLIEND